MTDTGIKVVAVQLEEVQISLLGTARQDAQERFAVERMLIRKKVALFKGLEKHFNYEVTEVSEAKKWLKTQIEEKLKELDQGELNGALESKGEPDELRLLRRYQRYAERLLPEKEGIHEDRAAQALKRRIQRESARSHHDDTAGDYKVPEIKDREEKKGREEPRGIEVVEPHSVSTPESSHNRKVVVDEHQGTASPSLFVEQTTSKGTHAFAENTEKELLTRVDQRLDRSLKNDNRLDPQEIKEILQEAQDFLALKGLPSSEQELLLIEVYQRLQRLLFTPEAAFTETVHSFLV